MSLLDHSKLYIYTYQTNKQALVAPQMRLWLKNENIMQFWEALSQKNIQTSN